MQDIQDLASRVTAAIPPALEEHNGAAVVQVIVHAALYAYAVDLLMSLGQAIQPTSDAEVAAVEWLRGQITAVAAQIPSATVNHKETVTS